MKNHMRVLIVVAGLIVSLSAIVIAQTDFPDRPMSVPQDADSFYWFIANLIIVLLIAFALWAVFSKMKHKKRSNISYHALGAVAVGMTLFSLFLYFIPATQSANVPPTERAWNWTADEPPIEDPGGSGRMGSPYRGYMVYLANGCTYCHTLYLRPQDVDPRTGWGVGARPEDVSEIGDYVNYPFTMLGTQRNGPDLTIRGREFPDMEYQVQHLIDPRRYFPNSVMPTYRYLSETDLDDLAAFIVSLGNHPDDLRTGALAPAPPDATLSESAQLGQKLSQSFGCLACHSTDGSQKTGPTWLGLYNNARAVKVASGGTETITASDAYLAESMTDPGAKVVEGFSNIMGPIEVFAAREVSDDEISAIIEYIKSLQGDDQ